MELADRLKMSLQRCRRETTSSEFVDWKVYMEQAWQRRTVDHYYLAQIAQGVRQVLHRNPQKVKLDHFLIQFEKSGPPKPPSQQEIQQRTMAAKAAWCGLLGVNWRDK